MQYLPSTGYGMTFRGETLSLAAAKAVLGVLGREDVCSHIERVGRRVRDAFQPLCARHGVRCELSGHPSRMSFVFHACGRLSWEQMRTLFLRECLERGLVTSGTLLPSYAMDDRGIERSLEVFDHALAAVAAAAGDGEHALGRPPGGSPWGPRPLAASGFLDWIREEPAGLRLTGWLLLDAGPAERVEIRTLTGDCVQALQVSRPDLLDAFPGRPEAADAGFQAFVPRSLLSTSKEHEFVLHFTRRGHTLFRCHVVRQALLPVDGSEGPYWLGDGVLYI
jgi:hypothetical protein